MRRALAIFRQFKTKTGHEHPYFRKVMRSYRDLLTVMKMEPDEIEQRIASTAESSELSQPIMPEDAHFTEGTVRGGRSVSIQTRLPRRICG